MKGLSGNLLCLFPQDLAIYLRTFYLLMIKIHRDQNLVIKVSFAVGLFIGRYLASPLCLSFNVSAEEN